MNSSESSKESDYILFLSSYPPRECGIATFTQDLILALDKRFNPVIKTEICALNDHSPNKYRYDSHVHYEINAKELENYVSLAKQINTEKRIKIVNVQHEFGIFGGEYGNYLIPFLQVLKKPVITTFHTVIPKPDDHLKKVVRDIADNSEAIVIMNELSKEILKKDYDLPGYKIRYIPHGIPQVPYEPSKKYKKKLGIENKIVLSTFGLINKNKGIEYAIKALPKIVDQFPNVIYLIIGKTHPSVKKLQDEKYRKSLKREVERLGLKNNVKFYDKYFTLEEIIQFLQATDIYIYPSIDMNQSVSGTLSYALGCGRTAVSTRTEYAKHILNKKNGILVNIKDSKEITEAVLSLISDKKTYSSMSDQAYKSSREMIWPNIAQSYFKLYRKFFKVKTEREKLPEIKFDHIERLTDKFGIIQHAKYSKPNKKFGYSSDDVSRALIACCLHYKNNPSKRLEKLMNIYLRFISFARRKDGSFANIISYQKKRDTTSEEDVIGRIIWTLGYVSSQNYLPEEIKRRATKLFKLSLPKTKGIKSLRSIAFIITGLYFYLKQYPDKNIKKIFISFSKYLINVYKSKSSPEWPWFEDFLTYSNSKLSEALFYSYDILKKKEYLEIAETSLAFLDSITFTSHYYVPIGQKGWYFKNQQRSYFDQQPEDTASMVQTKITAYKITKNKKYLKDALKAFYWFLGKNHLKLMVYNETTGGCHDGLGEYELNLNQGAESTISYILARLSLEDEEIKNLISKL